MILRNKEAFDDCNKALSLDENNPKAYFRKATALKGLGKLEEAIISIESGLLLDPNNQAALDDKCLLNQSMQKVSQLTNLMNQKQFRQSLLLVDALITTLGTNILYINMMKVKVLIGLNRPEDAFNITNTMMRAASANSNVELLETRAKCLYSMGDIENALKHLQQAMRVDPDNSSVRILLKKLKNIEDRKEEGNAAFKANRFQEAITAWTACINIDQENRLYNSKVYYNRASALSKLKRFEEAIRDCDRAIDANSEYVKVWWMEGGGDG